MARKSILNMTEFSACCKKDFQAGINKRKIVNERVRYILEPYNPELE